MEMDITGRLLHRDGLMLILNKPAGIPVHRGRGGGENLEQYFECLCFGLPNPPSLAHRLDKDTSGCLVLGRHRKALQKLGKLFEQGRVKKTYWALVRGNAPDSGRIEAPLRKASADPRNWRMEVQEGGQEAVTLFRILGRSEGISWLELQPLTGRTHQLRVHLAHLGCPIVGERIYAEPDGEMLHLHARAVEVPISASKPPVYAEAPPPEHMLPLLERRGYK